MPDRSGIQVAQARAAGKAQEQRRRAAVIAQGRGGEPPLGTQGREPFVGERRVRMRGLRRAAARRGAACHD
jgi:hypothetical protein